MVYLEKKLGLLNKTYANKMVGNKSSIRKQSTSRNSKYNYISDKNINEVKQKVKELKENRV